MIIEDIKNNLLENVWKNNLDKILGYQLLKAINQILSKKIKDLKDWPVTSHVCELSLDFYLIREQLENVMEELSIQESLVQVRLNSHKDLSPEQKKSLQNLRVEVYNMMQWVDM